MKAIVVRQPWATLIALGVKTIETRPGPPNGPMRPDGVRGLPGCTLVRGERVAIVAGAQPAPPEPFVLGDFHIYRHDARDSWLLNAAETKQWDLPLGAVVCTVTVDDALCVIEGPVGIWPDSGRCLVHWSAGDRPGLHPTEEQLLRLDRRNGFDTVSPQLPLGDFTPGRWGWLLDYVQLCAPVPCKGRQGVFVLPDDVAEKIG